MTKSYSFSKTQLDDKDWNTTLQGIYLTDLEFENRIETFETNEFVNLDGYIDNDSDLGEIWEDTWTYGTVGGTSTVRDTSTEVRNRNYSSGYYLNAQNSLFTSSADAYYYKIKIDITNPTYSASQVRWARYVIGTYTDLVNGTAEIGGLVNNLTTINKTVMNDFKSEPIYLGVLVCYYATLSDKSVDGVKNEYNNYASISFSADFDITYTPYYLDEGSGDISSELENQTDELEDVNSELNSQTSQMKEQNAELDKQTGELKEQTTTQKGMLAKMTEFFGSFFENLINSVIRVFVPTSEDMGILFGRLNDFFNEKFGFLFYPFDFIIEVFEIFLTADSSTGITFPSFELMGYKVWDSYTYDIAADDTVGTLFSYVRLVTGSILGFAFISYLRNYFDKRFGGGGS